MKDKLEKWARDKGEALQEISQDISWYSGKLWKKMKQTAQGMELKDFRLHTPPKEAGTEDRPEDFFPVADPQEEEKTLHNKLNWAIHRAYYKEGGFRYFGCNLLRYVNVVLPSVTNPEDMWEAGYNSCIQPMLWHLEKLEKELASVLAGAGSEMPKVEKTDLLEKMRVFQHMAYALGLDKDTGWEPEAYRQALRQYSGALNEQLLEPYRLPDDE